MNNLLSGTGIATVFVDHQLHIMRFTSTATQIINLIQSDIGRPVAHVVSNLFGYDRLMEDVQAVLDTLVPKEVEVQTKVGKWYTMHIGVYRTLDNVIDGVVITFVDITEAKKLREVLREKQAILEAAMDVSQVGIVIADAPGGILRYVNDAGLLIRGGDRQNLVDGVGIDQYVSSWQLMDMDGRPMQPDEVPLARAVKFGETCSREFIIRRAVGDDRRVLAKAAPVRDDNGEVTAGIVVFMDITDPASKRGGGTPPEINGDAP
jgi:PAS domain S-box-containing protein